MVGIKSLSTPRAKVEGAQTVGRALVPSQV